MHVQGDDSPTGSSGSETDAAAAATAAAGSSSSSSSRAATGAVGVPFPQTRAKPSAGIRGVCVDYRSCKVTAGAPLCPRCQRACCLGHRGSLEVALGRAFDVSADDSAVLEEGAFVATADDYCNACNEATAMQFRLTEQAATAGAAAAAASAPAAPYVFPYAAFSLPVPSAAAWAAGAASSSSAPGGSGTAGAASASAAAAIVVPGALNDAQLRKCWAYFTRWGYPHLANKRFTKVKERFHKAILEAATALASPTWPPGRFDLLGTLLSKEPVPIWYAAGAPLVAEQHEAAGSTGAAMDDSDLLDLT